MVADAMASPVRSNASTRRRRIIVAGVVAALAAFLIGAPIYVSRVEADLERAVPQKLAGHGFTGVTASFSGQDGTLTCVAPLSHPEQAVDVAYDVKGVRRITLDRSCRVNRAPTVGTTTTVPGATTDDSTDVSLMAAETAPTLLPAAFTSIAEVLATDPQFSLLLVLLTEAGLDAELADPMADPVTLFAPTDAAFDSLPADVLAVVRADPAALAELLRHHMVAGPLLASGLESGPLETLAGDSVDVEVDGAEVTVGGARITVPDATAENGIVHTIDSVLVPSSVDLEPPATEVTATVADGVLTLEGLVARENERGALLGALTGASPPLEVVDELAVDAEAGMSASAAGQLARLLAAIPGNLLSGVAGFDGAGYFVRGVVMSAAAGEVLTAVADEIGADAELTPRPRATEADAAELEEALNAIVADTPIRFEQGGTQLTAESQEVLDRLAVLALSIDGVAIVVEGHTDSDGSPARNAQLSQARADAVRDALIVRGLDEATLSAEGLGSRERIFVDGVEDKEASRRVEFRVTVID